MQRQFPHRVVTSIDLKPATSWRTLPISTALLIGIAAVLAGLDVLTTMVGLHHGYTEHISITQRFLAVAGVWGLGGLKLIVLAGLTLLAALTRKRIHLPVIVEAIIVHSFATVHNVFLLW